MIAAAPGASTGTTRPRLSVVVTIVDGGEALERCLNALVAQRTPPDLEVIVPYDDTVRATAQLASEFPTFRFLALGAVPTDRPTRSAAGQHELFDRRRAAGLAAATGEVVAMLEDRGVPDENWARVMSGTHERLSHVVIGGAIENGRGALLNWAVYFCDFGRFGGPFAPGPSRWASDINISYKRSALADVGHLWQDRFHETTVHWALLRAGETLYLTPEAVVRVFRDGLSLRRLILERVAWGRLFAYTRGREQSRPARLGYALLTPALPFLLFARQARQQFVRRRAATFLAASPAVAILVAAWSLGEAIGYLTTRP